MPIVPLLRDKVRVVHDGWLRARAISLAFGVAAVAARSAFLRRTVGTSRWWFGLKRT